MSSKGSTKAKMGVRSRKDSSNSSTSNAASEAGGKGDPAEGYLREAIVALHRATTGSERSPCKSSLVSAFFLG